MSEDISKLVFTQSDTSNTFSDIVRCVEIGLLDPDKLNIDTQSGIHLVAGALHGRRIRRILSRALDINPFRIMRYPITDIYDTSEYPRQRKESRQTAIAKELAANLVTDFVLRKVAAGDIESLKEAEQRLIALAKI